MEEVEVGGEDVSGMGGCGASGENTADRDGQEQWYGEMQRRGTYAVTGTVGASVDVFWCGWEESAGVSMGMIDSDESAFVCGSGWA